MLFWLAVCCLIVKSGNALTCLQCDGVSHPRHCRYVAECFDGEVCAVERVTQATGQSSFNIGCVHTSRCSSKTGGCHECCSSDLCNAKGCGEIGYPHDRGPICYHCPVQVDINSCNTIEFCEQGEVCAYTVRNEFGDQVYSSRCLNTHSCTSSGVSSSVIVGRDIPDEINIDNDKETFDIRSVKKLVCEGCCKEDLCNRACNSTQILPTDCYDIQQMNIGKTNGVYGIYLWKTHKFVEVLCDMVTDGGGWTVFQHRFNGFENFNRSFSEYTSGFGDPQGEFWLGLENVYELANIRSDMRIELSTKNGSDTYQLYNNFKLSPAPEYATIYSSTNGTAGSRFMKVPFSTYDNDQDFHKQVNCAQHFGAGWWYESCRGVDLNAPVCDMDNFCWRYHAYLNAHYSPLRTSMMMLRRV